MFSHASIVPHETSPERTFFHHHVTYLAELYPYTQAHGPVQWYYARVMYGKALSALAVLIMIGLTAGFFAWKTSREAGKTYKNTVYGYSLTYPGVLDVKEYSDEETVFGIVSNDAVDGDAEARVLTVQGEVGQTLQDAVAQQLKNYCAADGPNASFSCTDTISTEPYTTADGEMGFVLMLKGQYLNLSTRVSDEVPKGPYYVRLLATSATISKVLVISPPLNQSAADADKSLIRAIAESVRLTK